MIKKILTKSHKMKKNLTSLITQILLYLCFSSNINLIDRTKLNKSLGDVKNELEFLIQNEQFYNQWYAEWPFEDVSREEVASNLKPVYDVFLNKKVKNPEVELLLGDIAHFLHNLNEPDFSEIAVKHYKKAIQLSPKDYRAHWFLAYHYAQSGEQEESIDLFSKAKEMLPKNPPAEFWVEYAFAAMLANMPTTCLYAMDKAKTILKKESDFGAQFRESIKKRIVHMSSDNLCSKESLWNTSKVDDSYSFTSRPLGLKFSIKGNWGVELYDYNNSITAVTITPPAILNKKGKSIDYTITLMIKVAKKGDSLKSFVDSKFSNPEIFMNKESLNLPVKYPNQIGIQYKNPNLYPEMGGGRLVIIAFEKNYPQYPGLLLESVSSIPKNTDDKTKYYRAGQSNDRFKESIYYILILDTCEDIYEEGDKIFLDFFNNQLIAE